MFFKSIVRTTILGLVSSLMVLPSFSQTENLKVIERQLSTFNKNYQEKLFAHLDRSFYLTGENIWFKFYNVDGYLHQASDLSKVAYVELIDQNNKTVLDAKVALDKGKGSGFFYVPNTLSSGKYKFRAYTTWMKNFGEDFFFEREITIVNATRKLGIKATGNQPDIDIQFFPEGGNLVEGIESRIGFKAVNKESKSIDFKGYILNTNNDTLVRFTPLKFGIGSFAFKPSAGETYTAVVVSDKTKITKSLPHAFTSGCVIGLKEEGESLTLTVKSKDISGNRIYLLAQNKQSIKTAEYASLNNGEAVFTIEKSRLGEGINQLTIFNEDRQPLCERLYFKKPGTRLELNLKKNNDSFASRQKVSVEIAANRPSADLSMSVFLVDSLDSGQEDINSYIWLTSELSGNVESPSYYLNSEGVVVNQAIDNLMLTHGWRRFKWESVLDNKRPSFKYIPETKDLIVSALVRNKESGEPARKIMTYLSAPGKRTEFYVAETDSMGLARFPVRQFYGTREVVIQTNNEKDSVYKVEVVSPFAEPSKAEVSSFNLPETLQNAILNRSINSQVESTYLKGKKIIYSIPEIDSLPFYGTPNKTYLLDAYTRFPTIEEVMREYVPEATVRKHKGEFHFHVNDLKREVFFEDDPLILLDGVPIFNTHKFISFDPLKLKRLDVVSHIYFYGQRLSQGILDYHTYNGDLAGYELDPASIFIEYDGLQIQKEYYSPSYETEDAKASRIPDFRNSLFWAPRVLLDDAGKAKVDFFTSDAVGKYVVFVQGISEDGKAGSAITTIEVKKPL